MILGLIAGGVLRGDRRPWAKVVWLTTAGVVGLLAGFALGWLGICPVVKRIWTPSWVLFSGGWCFLLLAAFYAVIDVLGLRAWCFPLVVIGMNSIAAYCLSELFSGFIAENLETHLGEETFRAFGRQLPAAGSGRGGAARSLADPVLDVPAEALPAGLRLIGGFHTLREQRIVVLFLPGKQLGSQLVAHGLMCWVDGEVVLFRGIGGKVEELLARGFRVADQLPAVAADHALDVHVVAEDETVS